MNTPSPLNAVVQDAARKLASLQMTRIVGAPDGADAANLREDLEAIWGIVDTMILGIGEYAKDCLGITRKDVEQYFTDQLRGALEGNATHVLDCAGNDLDAAREAAE